MPPIRKRNKKPRGTPALPALRFTPVIGLEAHERPTAAIEKPTPQSVGEAVTRLVGVREERGLADESTVTHAIEESKQACDFAPTQAGPAVKRADAV